ncbi:putative Benzoate 4-monooxygenase cytochrome P450 [Pleurostoma richardsiae]|uniref:Benzoate 4-monooxygenase cytochrome P450 n=1 Tax=Pleurostoma richardsiae TaxID=41990 RepID=A0AA38VQ18_9PEZI|nr:putative Benzoate 4-monooxygenase cytochrome P450 [Pleurostoma richardsiae]
MYILAVVIGCALVPWIIKSIYRKNSGLKDIPNAHFSVPYSRLWLLLIKWNKLENRTRIHLHRRLGPVVRIGPREFDKDPSFYHALIDQTVFMVSIIGNDEHKKRRRMLSHYYSNTSILSSGNLDSVLSRVSSRLREGLAEWASTGASVDVFRQAKCCMLDVASGFLFGIENATDTLRDPTFQDDLTRLLAPSKQNLHVRTSLDWPMRPYFETLLGGNLQPDPVTREKWEAWLTGLIMNSHRTHPTKPSATHSLFNHFYDNFKAADPKMGLNDMASLIAAECDDHVSATHIGLGVLLSYTMYELSRKSDWQRALRKELLTVSEPSDQKLIHRLAKLPVLDAVLTETMRTRAPCPGPFPRVVPASGCRLAGKYDIPGGTIVSSSAWALHFNPLPFPSPDEWRPRRWLEADKDTVAEMRKWIWTFGSGTRVCIGTHFSQRVMKEIIFTIYTDYETFLDEEFTENVDQDDDFSSAPSSECIKLKFRRPT